MWLTFTRPGSRPSRKRTRSVPQVGGPRPRSTQSRRKVGSRRSLWASQRGLGSQSPVATFGSGVVGPNLSSPPRPFPAPPADPGRSNLRRGSAGVCGRPASVRRRRGRLCARAPSPHTPEVALADAAGRPSCSTRTRLGRGKTTGPRLH